MVSTIGWHHLASVGSCEQVVAGEQQSQPMGQALAEQLSKSAAMEVRWSTRVPHDVALHAPKQGLPAAHGIFVVTADEGGVAP